MTTNVSIDAAIALLTANGYRVTKPRPKRHIASGLNAIGKPYSASYDPNYRMQHRGSAEWRKNFTSFPPMSTDPIEWKAFCDAWTAKAKE